MVARVESKGLKRAKELYQDRPQRVKELKAEGKKVIGYLHLYPVLELLTAADLVPYAMLGDMREPITKADSCLPTIVCPFLRSIMDIGLKGRYDFLDGVVMAHMCEVGEKLAHVWRTYIHLPYSFFLDTPHATYDSAVKQHKEQLKVFKKSLESSTGKEITLEKLREAIKLHNEQRALVRELYDLRKPDPPLISGVETLQVLIATMSIPVEEGNDLLRQVISDVKVRRDGGPEKKPARLLLWGSMIDDTALVEVIESVGANLVMDDIWVGSSAYFSDVEVTEDPLDGLAYRYLMKLKCPRTFRGSAATDKKRDYMKDLEKRFGYLRDYARDWNVNGIILETIRYCDIHGYEVPGLRDYLDSVGLPNAYVEHDYSEAALAPIRTRIQGFVEVLG
ncbi:MAG: 2-hydroxyacyl-CoA dehydratase [Chloroflexi bacterium]|nr:2-hydroxyacyl-CoA dehydratase [Chloroflexota bacterium]